MAADLDRRIGFARWRSDLPSGGNRYDDELAAGLRALGWDLREYDVTGSWPLPDDHDRQHLVELLGLEQRWLMGNIVAAAVPTVITAATAAGRDVVVMLHYFPADDPSIPPADRRQLAVSDAAAVWAASTVLVTSSWAAREVAARYGRQDAVVAVPGVVPAPLAPGTAGPGRAPVLLWLARLTPTKDPLTFVDALAQLQDLDWTARLVGPDTVDEALSRRVAERITGAGMDGRVTLMGSREGVALESVWAGTDLLVHTSRHETYGMVVSEALARGIASVVVSGTGAVEAQAGAGAAFPAGDAEALAEILRDWLTNERTRQRWRRDALKRRAHLPTWDDTAQMVSSVLSPPLLLGRQQRQHPSLDELDDRVGDQGDQGDDHHR